MKEKDVKNTVDSAHPHPAGIERLSEEEKTAMEISGRLEHSHGSDGEDLAGEDGGSSGAVEKSGGEKKAGA